jgi:hypothetical protein
MNSGIWEERQTSKLGRSIIPVKGTRPDPLLPEAVLQKALPRRPQWDQHERPSLTEEDEQTWREGDNLLSR